MSDIVKKSDELIQNLKDKSLGQKVSQLKDKLAKLGQYKNSVILCDVSGSMAIFVGNGNDNLRAIDIVNNVLQNFQGCNLWEFSSYDRVHHVTKLSQPNGSTAMDAAFDVMKSQGFKEIILLTDGAPDSPPAALNSAKGLKINIIYIGPQPTPQFLIDLARATYGNFVDVELIKLGKKAEGQLENKIKGFLNP